MNRLIQRLKMFVHIPPSVLGAFMPDPRSQCVVFRCVQQGAVDMTTSMGKLILGILVAVAEFETDIRKERQGEGIERAKAAGA